MRRVLVLLAVFASLPGCRRTARSPEPAAAPALPAASAVEGAGAAVPQPVPAHEAAAPAAKPPATTGPAGVAAAPSAAVIPASAAAPAAPPSPVAGAATPAPTGPAASPDPDQPDETLYSWTDEHGTLHFSSGTDVPDDRRRSARRVGGGITIVPAPPDAPAAAATASGGDSTAPASEGTKAVVKGAKPALDAQGLPIPGTMEETGHTRAVKQATGVELDPASVERRYQQQLRDMNCREENGVVTCG